jgi:hypothetical protein
MRGDNDAGLNFPFNYKVSFCLFDQTPQQRHIIKSIRPKRSASFQRPQSEMNIPHEILKFCSLATFQQVGSPYIQDDSILIKVMINTGDISRALLPYAFSLESGLSIDVQRAMIRKKTRETRSITSSSCCSNESEWPGIITNYSKFHATFDSTKSKTTITLINIRIPWHVTSGSTRRWYIKFVILQHYYRTINYEVFSLSRSTYSCVVFDFTQYYKMNRKSILTRLNCLLYFAYIIH